MIHIKCSICGQPVRIIPTNNKLKDIYNKGVLTIGRCCMRCAIAYQQVNEEANTLTYEERAKKTLKRMKSQGMTKKQINEAIKQANEKEQQK